MPSGSADSRKPYDEVLDQARLGALRDQQAVFNEERRRIEREPQNRLLAYGALAAPLAVMSLEAPVAVRGLIARPTPKPPSFDLYPHRKALSFSEKGPIWKKGRPLFERANGMSAKDMGKFDRETKAWEGRVHHRLPNEHANKLPGADPNRLANLQAIPQEVHSMVTSEWGRFLRSFNREPTPAELQQFTQKMDRLIEPYTLRRGLPRPPPRLQKPTKVKP